MRVVKAERCRAKVSCRVEIGILVGRGLPILH
jgi:hypothetical protein